MNEKHYWLHRANYMGGLEILKTEGKLTIGFSDIRDDAEACVAIEKQDFAKFCSQYERVYSGGIPRLKNILWRFTVEMSVGDIIVVPCPWGFYVCRVKSNAASTVRGDLDLGWEREVELLTEEPCSPREDYAKAGLLSRMKCRQTNLCIDDLAEEVELAIDRKFNGNPFNMARVMTEKCLEVLRENTSSDYLESLVQTYFQKLGAETEILSKNYSGKVGDCDVRAEFEHLNLTVFVQCKKHTGITDDRAVRQITDYTDNEIRNRAGCSCQSWVISTAEDFTAEAKQVANEQGIVLLNGQEFCRRALSVGAFGAL